MTMIAKGRDKFAEKVFIRVGVDVDTEGRCSAEKGGVRNSLSCSKSATETNLDS